MVCVIVCVLLETHGTVYCTIPVHCDVTLFCSVTQSPVCCTLTLNFKSNPTDLKIEKNKISPQLLNVVFLLGIYFLKTKISHHYIIYLVVYFHHHVVLHETF